MSKLVINSFEDFEKYVGQPLGESEYLQVDQERINLFADATLDHQWIHTDVERAQKESPFKSTIVHGYLTLSLLPYLWNQIIEVNNLKMMINYGIDKMKFGQAVLSGQSLRLSTKLESLANLLSLIHLLRMDSRTLFTGYISGISPKNCGIRLSKKDSRSFFIFFVAKTPPLRLPYKNIAHA